MKIYIILWLILIALYAGFHFGFRNVGERQFYRINDSIAFELLSKHNPSYNEVTIHGYRRTNPVIRFMCGCEVDYSESDVLDAQYIKGDWVYWGYPQYSTVKPDIVNLRTGEVLRVDAPENDESLFDLQTIPEYRERGLVKGEQYRLTQDYVKANFERLPTYTTRCLWIHLAFGILALFIIFPRLLMFVLEMIAGALDPNNPNKS